MNPAASVPEGSDSRDAVEKLYFARGVLEILKGTGLFNFLIDRAIADVDDVARELETLLAATRST